MTKTKTGFTLIEILITIGMIAILAAVVIIAINPARQFALARDSQRTSNVNTILNAVYQYASDNNGLLPAGIPTVAAGEICATNVLPADCVTGSLVDLSVLTDNAIYLVELPIDPSCPTGCSADGIDYEIIELANGRITVSAPNAEESTISVTR